MDDEEIMMLVAPYSAMIAKLRDDNLVFYFRISNGEDVRCDLTIGEQIPDYVCSERYGLKAFSANMCRKYVIIIYEHEDGVPVVYKFEM